MADPDNGRPGDLDEESIRCPRCGRPGDLILEPGEVCEACQAASPWREIGSDEPAAPVKITLEDIEAAEARRHGYQPRTRVGVLAVKVLLPGLAAALSLASLVQLALMLAPRELTDISSAMAALSAEATRVTALGGAALFLGVGLLVVLRRSRLFRAWAPLGMSLLAVPCGAAGLLMGGLFWTGTSSPRFKHTTMPPIPQEVLEDTYKARIARAVVVVFAPDPGGDIMKSGLGSGTVVIREPGKVGILTNSHVALPDQSPSAFREADPSRKLYVTFADGRVARAAITWVAPPPVDMAILEASIEDGPKPAEVSRSADALKKGAKVAFAALPYRHGWRFHQGKILKRWERNTPAGRFSLMFADLPAESGDSGSGLYDAGGRLVGVITWKYSDGKLRQGISLPSDALFKYFKLPRDGGKK